MAAQSVGENRGIGTAEEDGWAFICTIVLILFCSALFIGPAVLPPNSRSSKLLVQIGGVFTVLLPVLVGAVGALLPPDRVPNLERGSLPRDKLQGSMPGFWGRPLWWHGQHAIHDFCEENFRYNRFVAEFHNTWSSMPMMFFACVGPWYTRSFACLESRFSWAFTSIGCIGLGSLLFHGTLLRWGQVLDEAPMMFLLFVLIFMFVEDGPQRRFGLWFPLLLGSLCASFVLAYLILNVYSFFLFSFTAGTCILLLNGAHVVRTASRLTRRLFCTGVAFMALGFALWLVDHHLCWRVQNLRLHIAWHFLAGLACYLFVMAFLSHRADQLGRHAIGIFPNVAKLLLGEISGELGLQAEVGPDGCLKWRACALPEFLLPYVAFKDAAAGRSKKAKRGE